MQVRFNHKTEIAPGIISLFFEPLEKYSHTAGQFVEINLQHDHPDKRGIRRWFTISSAPDDEFLTITTRFADKNSSSFKRAFTSLKPDTVLSFSPPEGDFCLPTETKTKLIFVAGGIGITPVHSMVKHLLNQRDQRDVRVLYGLNTLEDAIFMQVFDEYQADTELILSDAPKSWEGATGFITADQIIAATKSTDHYQIYLSGPEPMVEKLNDDLRAQGIASKHIKTDFFPGYVNI
jgi:ferredoxin-NADP reductase